MKWKWKCHIFKHIMEQRAFLVSMRLTIARKFQPWQIWALNLEVWFEVFWFPVSQTHPLHHYTSTQHLKDGKKCNGNSVYDNMYQSPLIGFPSLKRNQSIQKNKALEPITALFSNSTAVWHIQCSEKHHRKVY